MTESTSTRSFQIETILANRWSPRAYSSTEVVTSDRLGPAFEAARWSPSSGNSQPWSFVVGFRGDAVFTQIVETMASGNAVWAEKASAVVANIAELVSEEGKERPHAIYDLGQAVAHFSVQATANGLMVHQMAGFDADAVGEVLGLGERHRVISLMTVGVLGDPRDLPEKLQEREGAPRVRKPLHVVATGGVNYA